MIERFLGDAFGVLSYQFWSIVLQPDARLPILLDRPVSGALFLKLGVCLSVTFHIVNPWQSYVCFIRSGVNPCTLLMVLSLDRMCQRELHAVLWSHIGTLMHRLTAEPCSTAGLLFPSRCPSGTILLSPHSIV